MSLDVLNFWLSVGVLVGIYGIFTLGLQLNIGLTGVTNLGAAGFMAIGAYTMAICVNDLGWPQYAGVLAGLALSTLCGVLLGLPALRLRADYFGIATIAFSEIVRISVQNAEGLTGGAQGLFGYNRGWSSVSQWVLDWAGSWGVELPRQAPLFLLTTVLFLGLAVILRWMTRTPWGRVVRAVREDQDAAASVGKNAYSYKLQSMAVASFLAGLSGCLLAVNLAFIGPTSFLPAVTFVGLTALVLGGIGSFGGVVLGSVVIWSLVEGTRFFELPFPEQTVASMRYVVIGLVLVLLMRFRPIGVLGNKQEMILSD